MEPTYNKTEVANSTPATSTKSTFDKKQLITPIAIIVAGALIAFGLYVSGNKKDGNGQDLVKGALAAPEFEIAKVTDADHIRGNKDAKIVIIEYSDIECPFCKVYHDTMKKIHSEYKADEVAWVYRHFPLSYGEQALHKNAAKEAEATECVAELGGQDKFWSFVDELYSTTKSNDGLDLSLLPEIGSKLGVDKAKLKACIDSGKYATKVKESYEAGLKAGAAGTPYTVIQFNGEDIPLVNEQGQGLGALPYDVMKKIVDQMLAAK
ncbi:MAG: DsbA family protein [Patescibacteria group bacterium]